MAIVASTLVEAGRAIIALMQPITGGRAAATVRPELDGAASEVTVFPGTYLVPVVGGQTRPDMLFKVAPRQGADPKWRVPADERVAVVSNLGGARHNLPEGTKMRWSPLVPGLKPETALGARTQQATDPAGEVRLHGAVQYEAIGTSAAGLDLFRSKLDGRFPAAVVGWAGSEPADGLATSTLSRGGSRVGEGRQLYSEQWQVSLVVSRVDSDEARRSEALLLLDEVTALVTDKQSVDGVVFSNPAGVQVRGRGRLVLPAAGFQDLAIYTLSLATTGRYERRDARSYGPLERFNVDVPKDDDENLDVVKDMEIEL